MLSKELFIRRFYEELRYLPTSAQEQVMNDVCQFIFNQTKNQLFILKGYAGTGKTTLMSALVRTLDAFKIKNVLLALTGRAAKVFSYYAGKKAFTIHKHIYRVSITDNIMRFSRKENKSVHTLFIVDEVSMISDKENGYSRRSLLEDLLHYVWEGENCKLLFIGDEAQLPPVQETESPALNLDYLHRNFNLDSHVSCLDEVVRQALDSGILFNANVLRKKIEENHFQFPLFSNRLFPDFKVVTGGDMEDLLNTLYSKYPIDEIVTITRSNKRACIFNQEIRNRVLGKDGRLAAGDYIMAVKNNYYWVNDSSEAGFIANGEIMEILSIHKYEDLYGFHFADITVRLCDYAQHPSIDMKILLDSIDSNEASLSTEKNQELYYAVAEDYVEITDKRLRYLKIKNDPYLNALQVKFAYSLTCHKTQGGQWQIVLIDQLFLQNGLDKEMLRWLYTAITRSTEKVWLINYPEKFFG